MTLQEIKDAVNEGKVVYWCNKGYKVFRWGSNSDYVWYITHYQGNAIGLTNHDGVTLNGDESEFFIAD